VEFSALPLCFEFTKARRDMGDLHLIVNGDQAVLSAGLEALQCNLKFEESLAELDCLRRVMGLRHPKAMSATARLNQAVSALLTSVGLGDRGHVHTVPFIAC